MGQIVARNRNRRRQRTARNDDMNRAHDARIAFVFSSSTRYFNFVFFYETRATLQNLDVVFLQQKRDLRAQLLDNRSFARIDFLHIGTNFARCDQSVIARAT